MMITDFADEFRGMPLPLAELKQVQYAVRLLRSAPAEWLQSKEVLVPLHNGRLGLATRAFVPDDPRVKTLILPTSLPLIEDNDDSIDVGRRSGATSLHTAMTERLKSVPMLSKTSGNLQFAAKLERSLRSEQFYQSLRRIAYEEATRITGMATDPKDAASRPSLTCPARIKILITPLINIETIVNIDDDETVIFEKEAGSFLERENLRLWLKEGKPRRMRDKVVRVVCDLCGLYDILTVNRILEAEPTDMSSVLDEEEIATIPEGKTLNLDDIGESEVDAIEYDFDAFSDSENMNEDHEADAEWTGADTTVITLPQPESTMPAGASEGLPHRVGQHVEPSSDNISPDHLRQSTGSITQNADLHDTANFQDEPPTTPGHGSSRPWGDQHSHHHSTDHGSRRHVPVTPSGGHAGRSVPSGIHGRQNPTGNHLRTATESTDTAQQVRLRTYLHEHPQDDYDNSDSNSLAHEIGDLGERVVLEHEKKRNREAKQMPRNHEGYDIESTGRDGIRYIEVKSIDGPWGIRGVGVTRAQYEAAIRLGKSWWLYVVEHVKDPNNKKVHPIPNPFHSATEFRFDSGWAGASLHQVGITPDSTKPKIGARYQRETGEIIRVENTVQRGQFWRVTYTAPDGSRQGAVWDLTWRMI